MAMINKGALADLIIQADIQREVGKLEEEIREKKVRFVDHSQFPVPEEILNVAHRIAVYIVALTRKGMSARYN